VNTGQQQHRNEDECGRHKRKIGRLDRHISNNMALGDVTVTGAAGHLSAQDRSHRAQEVIFDIIQRDTRALCVLPFGHKETTWTTRRF
jgi:hypothetical protein